MKKNRKEQCTFEESHVFQDRIRFTWPDGDEGGEIYIRTLESVGLGARAFPVVSFADFNDSIPTEWLSQVDSAGKLLLKHFKSARSNLRSELKKQF